jgi:hypothetical protein
MNQTFDEVKIPVGIHLVGSRFVFSIKANADNTIERFKTRWVAQGYSQKEGIDYNETYSPVGKYESLRILFVLAAINDLEILQADFTTAFLNGELKETIYMKYPDGYPNPKPGHCLKLRKAIYGLKQASNEWFKLIRIAITRREYKQIISDQSVFIKVYQGNTIIIWLYVDDILVFCPKDILHDGRADLVPWP